MATGAASTEQARHSSYFSLFGKLVFWQNSRRLEKLFTVIHEDDDLLVVHKPADLVCHPTKGDEYSSLISRARLYRGDSGTPHLVNRLDRETSGIVLIAKNAIAAGELGKIWETRAVTKEYVAMVHGRVAAEQGIIEAPLGKDTNSIVAIKDCVRSDGAAAQTEYWVETRFSRLDLTAEEADLKGFEGSNPLSTDFTQLRVIPRTGRKHQIRIHLAHIGHPIVGDKLYGGDEDLYLALVEGRLTDSQQVRLILPNHALQAVRLVFNWREVIYDFNSPPDEGFNRFPKGQAPTEGK
jgi:23S rRNA pseudouridine1911/1915/1917 synthase